mmetsp:Transcript_3454/g.9852  ORF Transcript_3454/g.9852 Transcript_3454/m.9852 type:complete len:89 (+) Transcript_3454:91-357(+)
MVLRCETAESIMAACEKGMQQFSASETLAAIHLVARRADNFKVRRDPVFAELVGRTAVAVASSDVLPRELAGTSWAVAKLGLRNWPLR